MLNLDLNNYFIDLTTLSVSNSDKNENYKRSLSSAVYIFIISFIIWIKSSFHIIPFTIGLNGLIYYLKPSNLSRNFDIFCNCIIYVYLWSYIFICKKSFKIKLACIILAIIFTIAYIYNMKIVKENNYEYADMIHRLCVQTPAMLCLYLILNC